MPRKRRISISWRLGRTRLFEVRNKRMNDFSLNRPIKRNGPNGFPLIGSTLTWMKNPTAFALQLYEQYGPIVDVNICFKNVVYLLGVEANERVLIDRNQAFSNQRGWFLLSRLFAGGLMLQ